MKVYRLGINPGEADGEGEDHDEWFSSLQAAKRRRAELSRDTPAEAYKYSEDYEIEEIVLAKLPPKQLALACLNYRGFATARREVVIPYKPRSR